MVTLSGCCSSAHAKSEDFSELMRPAVAFCVSVAEGQELSAAKLYQTGFGVALTRDKPASYVRKLERQWIDGLRRRTVAIVLSKKERKCSIVVRPSYIVKGDMLVQSVPILAEHGYLPAAQELAMGDEDKSRFTDGDEILHIRLVTKRSLSGGVKSLVFRPTH